MLTKRFRTIAVRIPAGSSAGREFSLQEQDDLKGAIIDGIETYNDQDLLANEQGLPIITAADSVKLVTYYVEDSTDRVKAVPYTPQRTAQNAGVIREYRNLVMNFPNSRIRVTQLIANGSDSYALIGVHFHYASDVRG